MLSFCESTWVYHWLLILMSVKTCSILNCSALFSNRQWRHVGQALHTDWEPREHWVSLTSQLWQIYWNSTEHSESVPHCCDTEGMNSNPFSHLLLISHWITWTLLSHSTKKNCFLCRVCNCWWQMLFLGSHSTPAVRPRGCWVRLWSSVGMVQASTVTWTATAPSNRSLSLPTKSAWSSAKEERPSNNCRSGSSRPVTVKASENLIFLTV